MSLPTSQKVFLQPKMHTLDSAACEACRCMASLRFVVAGRHLLGIWSISKPDTAMGPLPNVRLEQHLPAGGWGHIGASAAADATTATVARLRLGSVAVPGRPHRRRRLHVYQVVGTVSEQASATKPS